MTKFKRTTLSALAFITTFLVVVILTPYDDQRPLFYLVALTIALTISFLLYFPASPKTRPGFDSGIAELGIVIAFGFIIAPVPFAALYFVLSGADDWVYVLELIWLFLWAAYYVYASSSLKFIVSLAQKEEERNWAKETVEILNILSLTAADMGTRNSITRLSDEIRSSNTRTTLGSQNIEGQITAAIDKIGNSIEDKEAVKGLLTSAMTLIKQRQLIVSRS